MLRGFCVNLSQGSWSSIEMFWLVGGLGRSLAGAVLQAYGDQDDEQRLTSPMVALKDP
jgi:hypothetical protein